jgi:hypothetical protein
MSGSLPLPPRPPLDIMRELERPTRRPRMQEFDVPAALAAEQRRSASRQSLPLPPIPPAVAPPRTAGDSAEAGPPRVFPGETAGDAVPPRIGSVLPADNPWVSEAIKLAEKYNLPRDVFLSLVYQESKFNPEARSRRGAYGLTQLMPGTAADLRADRYDPAQNLDAGARYLRQQIDRFGSLPLALAAYNAGPNRVAQAGNQIPRITETQDYVKNIMRRAGVEGYAEGGLAELDEKYAEGGRVRRPAAAPVPRPSDEDYLSILADRAVGAGEPVAELRSAEGRGFVPMPRSFGEAGQRLSAVVRGDVEPTPEEERQINVVRGFAEGPASIRAYHGSPYRFDRFDISKIGTGEGATAYGRGLYFAEKEPIASYYMGNPEARYARFSGHMAPREEFAFDIATKPNARDWDVIEALVRKYGDTISFDEANALAKKAMENRGHLYEVRLRTTPEELVNWDAPLVRQPERAVPFLEDVLRAPRTGSARVLEREMKPIGEAIDLRTPEIAAQLREAGVPGIRYLDAGSRTGRQNTRNYVMFGDDLIDITRRYAEGGLAELDQKYADGGMVREPATAYDPDEIDRIVQEFAEGGEVEAPAKTYIGGQEHKLAYITDREAALLKARGGSGRMTKHGIRAYNDANNDNANSNSEAAAQDAAGGNQGQGAGPTGAGAGAGPPGPPDSNPNQSMSSEDPEGTQAAANMQTAVDAREAGRGYGIADTGGVAPTGFNAAPGIAEALGALGRGEIGFGQALGYGVQSAMSPPGVQMGVNVDEIGNQTPAVSVSVPGVIGGLMGLATGIPGASAIGSMIGNEIGKELGLDPTVMSYEPGVFNAPEPTPAYGSAYDQPFAHGGLAKLHQKYAEGGEVEGNGGVERYDPREIDALASEFMAESNPADLMQRTRMMMRGVNVGMPTNVGALNLSDNENVSTYTGLREMPIEDDRFARALRTLNTGINATLDQERGIRLGAGLQALQDAGDRGMSGYGANLSAGYGPVSLHGGYQSQLQAYPGAKPQEFYTYGGNLNIPLDDEGAKALLGAQVMSGRRGSAGAGNAGTLITGGLERPFLEGTLGVDVSVDPTLRNKEILFGYRRAF